VHGNLPLGALVGELRECGLCLELVQVGNLVGSDQLEQQLTGLDVLTRANIDAPNEPGNLEGEIGAFALVTTAGGGGFMPDSIFMIISTLIPAMIPINASTATIMMIMRLVVLGLFSTRVCMRGVSSNVNSTRVHVHGVACPDPDHPQPLGLGGSGGRYCAAIRHKLSLSKEGGVRDAGLCRPCGAMTLYGGPPERAAARS
jgi:hypothetical protein